MHANKHYPSWDRFHWCRQTNNTSCMHLAWPNAARLPRVSLARLGRVPNTPFVAAFGLGLYLVLAPVDRAVADAVCVITFASLLYGDREAWGYLNILNTLRARSETIRIPTARVHVHGVGILLVSRNNLRPPSNFQVGQEVISRIWSLLEKRCVYTGYWIGIGSPVQMMGRICTSEILGRYRVESHPGTNKLYLFIWDEMLICSTIIICCSHYNNILFEL
jgi:hypothetical protein